MAATTRHDPLFMAIHADLVDAYKRINVAGCDDAPAMNGRGDPMRTVMAAVI